jgi:outer membrane protein assembly factor BamB
VGDTLYALGSDGDLACLELASGKVKWQKSLRNDFAGKPGTWAYAESPLVDGDTLVCTPGGSEATIVGLDRTTGQVRWKCATPEGDEAAYASAIVLDLGGTRQYVQLLQKGLVGVEARTGKLLWRFSKPTSAFNANIPSPLASGNCIFVGSAGTGGGAVRIHAKGGNFETEQLYFNPKLPTAIGGVVKVGDYLYGTGGQGMLCLDFGTGEVKWQERALGPASLCFADGRLYLHGENGEVALVEPSPESYREKGRFAPPDQPKHSNQMEKAWAYPVVADGRLYLRDHDMLWCYAVR